MLSCWHARSFSPSHAAAMASISIICGPLKASFSTGRSSTARRASLRASSFLPRAASISPRTHRAGPWLGWACTTGVADYVDEEDIGDLELNFLLNLCGHGGEFYSV